MWQTSKQILQDFEQGWVKLTGTSILSAMILTRLPSKYVYNIAIIPYDLIIAGELNFHVDNKFDVEPHTSCSI